MKYRVTDKTTGINYGDKRVECGEIAEDIPAESVPWLLEQGWIEEVSEGLPALTLKADTSAAQQFADRIAPVIETIKTSVEAVTSHSEEGED